MNPNGNDVGEDVAFSNATCITSRLPPQEGGTEHTRIGRQGRRILLSGAITVKELLQQSDLDPAS